MAVGMLTVLLSPEPVHARWRLPATRPSGCVARWSSPSPTSWAANRWQALLVLGLIAIYRISDVVMGIMANPFYVDMGFTKDECAAVTKV